MNRYVRIVMLAALMTIVCGAVHAAEINVGTEPHITSGAVAPACSVQGDECISETAAIQRWGVAGYEMSSKTICGQSADAMVQYYCIHPVAPAAPAAQATTAGAAVPAATAAPATTQKSPLPAGTGIVALCTALLAAAHILRR